MPAAVLLQGPGGGGGGSISFVIETCLKGYVFWHYVLLALIVPLKLQIKLYNDFIAADLPTHENSQNHNV